jgi:glycogen operon protein
VDDDLRAFTRRVVELRRSNPTLHRRRWLTGEADGEGDLPDVGWFSPSGGQMTERQWDEDFAKCVAVFLNGDGIPFLDRRGEPVRGDSFLLLFNAHHEDVTFKLPGTRWAAEWATELDTADPGTVDPGADERVPAAASRTVTARSAVVLRAVNPAP